jgi:flagellar biosynthesis chaperone FliJ
MPAADSQMGIGQQAAGTMAKAPDSEAEDGLVTALSAFLSQLHAGFDDTAANEPGGPAAVAPLRHHMETAPHPGLGPAGEPGRPLPRRLGATTGSTSTPATRVLGAQPPKATAVTAKPTDPALTHVPQVNEWDSDPFTHGRKIRPQPTPAVAPARPAVAPARPAVAPARPAAAKVQPLAGPDAAASVAASTAPEPPGLDLNEVSDAPAPEPTKRGPNELRFGPRMAIALLVSLGLVAGVGISVAWWGRSQATALSESSQQLATTQRDLSLTLASLESAHGSLSSAKFRIDNQLRDIRALDGLYTSKLGQLDATKAEVGATKAEMGKVEAQLNQTQGQLDQTQGQLTQAQDQVGQAQDQLGHTQDNLTVTQAHAATCQQGASLGQEMSQLQGAFILLEDGYLTALQAKDAGLMQKDLGQMEALDNEAQAVSPQFISAVGNCTH